MIKNVRGHGKVWYTTSTFLTEEAAMEQLVMNDDGCMIFV